MTFRELGADHGGVLARQLLVEAGLSRDAIRAQLAAERWQRLSRRVLVEHNGPLTDEQRRWAALLHACNGSALCGPTAAALDGLVGYQDENIHVVLPPGGRLRPITGLTVVPHFSRLLGGSHVHPTRTPRRTRIERSLVDMAVWAPDRMRGCAVLAAGVQQRLVRPAQLQRSLDRPGPLRRRRILSLAVADIAGGAHSLAEIDAVRLCRRGGLPAPAQQLVRYDAAGRRRYLDLPWPEFGVVAEVDGAIHLRPRGWWDDMDRQNEIAIATGVVLRFPAMVLRLQPERFVDQVSRALQRGGWRPSTDQPGRLSKRAS
jgi:hypothetical protein